MTDFKKIKYSDFADIKSSDFDELIRVFGTIDKAFEALTKEVNKNSENVQKSINQITESTKVLKKELNNVNPDSGNASSSIDKITRKLTENKEAVERLRKEKKELTATEKELEKERKKQERLLAKEAIKNEEIIKQNERLSIEIQKNTRERKKQLKIEASRVKVADKDVEITETQIESIDELNSVLSLNITQYNKLSKEQRENEEIGGKLLSTIQDQKEELSKLKKEYGDTTGNVGNYKDSVIEALNETLPFAGTISGLKDKMLLLKSNIGQATGSLGKLKTALLATGIGAVVIALSAMSTALSKTEAGSNKLREAGAGLSASFNVFLGDLGSWGNSLLGIDDANEKAERSTKGLFERAKEARDIAIDIERLTIQYEKQIVQLERLATTYRAQAQLQLDIQENDALGYEERKRGAIEAQVAIEDSFSAQLLIIQKQTEIARANLAEAERTGLKKTELENIYQEVLAKNSEIESDYLDFVRNQAELRLKAFSDEAESRLDVAVIVNEALKDAQREILDNEKSTIAERSEALLSYNRTQSESLKEAKQDVIDFIELSRSEAIKLSELQIDGIKRVAKEQGEFTREQSKQIFVLNQNLQKQQALKEEGFNLDKIINAETTEAVIEQFRLQGIGEKFQLRIIEFLQLEKEQRTELNQLIRDNAEKEKDSLKAQLEFRLKANNLTKEEITKLAVFRLETEQKLLNDQLITQAEFNERRLEEEKRINEELLKETENNQKRALELRQEYGKLTEEELDRLVEFDLKKERELLDQKLISQEVFNAKKKEIRDSYNSEDIAETKSTEDEKSKILAEAAKQNIAQETAYRNFLKTPIANTLIDESAKQIESEIIRAGILAYAGALQQGKTQSEATNAGFQALASAQIIKTFAKTAKKDGGTVMGSEGLVWMNEEGPEFVVDHSTTKSLGLANNASMGDFHSKISDISNDGYLKAMAEISQKSLEMNNNIAFNFPSAKEIGSEVANQMPYGVVDQYDKHIRLIIKSQSRKRKEVIYKDRKRHL